MKYIEEIEYWLELIEDSGCVPGPQMTDLLDETGQINAIQDAILRQRFESISFQISLSGVDEKFLSRAGPGRTDGDAALVSVPPRHAPWQPALRSFSRALGSPGVPRPPGRAARDKRAVRFAPAR